MNAELDLAVRRTLSEASQRIVNAGKTRGYSEEALRSSYQLPELIDRFDGGDTSGIRELKERYRISRAIK